MVKVLSILVLVLWSTTSLSLSKDQSQTNPAVNSSAQQMAEDSEDIENQQINKDEGYGPDDQEYYESEETNSDMPFQDNTQANRP